MTPPAWGPQIEANATRFRLWAPGRAPIELQIGDNPPMPMNRAPEDWYELQVPAKPGVLYRFLVDGVAVPDPGARAQKGSYSRLCNPDGHRWQDDGWRGRPWEETIIYEIHVGLMGGFTGVAARLSEWANLGITAIELMPIADFPGTRNWGYDGVLPFAPDETYGTPDELKALIDQAHALGLMVFLDVVYNHFGPDGNYLPLYAPEFFRADRQTPWGAAIDFRVREVRQFFIENALYWIQEFHIDGLRLDAVHAIGADDFLIELVGAVRAGTSSGRYVHLMLENERNDATLLIQGYDAQWNDDLHHVLHVLLTDETAGYYREYADATTDKLARALAEGFVYQGEFSANLGAPRGNASKQLPPTAFVAFLQNHDHIGNRAFGDRLITLVEPAALKAAAALILLCPQIPMLFMGEEAGARAPFLYFSDHSDPALAASVRDGRRAEFARFPEFTNPAKRETIPDPNAVLTFEASRPEWDCPDAAQWTYFYGRLLSLRHRVIVPRLMGARSLQARAIGPKAVVADWRMGDGSVLTLAINLSTEAAAAPLPNSVPLWGQAERGMLAPYSTLCWIDPP